MKTWFFNILYGRYRSAVLFLILGYFVGSLAAMPRPKGPLVDLKLAEREQLVNVACGTQGAQHAEARKAWPSEGLLGTVVCEPYKTLKSYSRSRKFRCVATRQGMPWSCESNGHDLEIRVTTGHSPRVITLDDDLPDRVAFEVALIIAQARLSGAIPLDFPWYRRVRIRKTYGEKLVVTLGQVRGFTLYIRRNSASYRWELAGVSSWIS